MTLLVSVAVTPLAGQRDPRERRIWRLVDNEKLLSVGFSLDRTEYLPQEAATITLKIKNPTKKRVSVIWPLFIFEVLSVRPDGTTKPLMPPPDRDTTAPINTNVPTVTLQPGEERVVHIDSFKAIEDDEPYSPMPPLGSVPQEPGQYQIEFRYGTFPKAKFTVIEAKLGKQAVVRLPHDAVIRSSKDASPEKLQQFRYAFELLAGDVSYICLSRESIPITGDSHPDWRLALTPTVDGGPDTAAPHKRIAQTREGVASIQLAVNERDQFKVTWTDLHANKHVEIFDADLNRVDDE